MTKIWKASRRHTTISLKRWRACIKVRRGQRKNSWEDSGTFFRLNLADSMKLWAPKSKWSNTSTMLSITKRIKWQKWPKSTHIKSASSLNRGRNCCNKRKATQERQRFRRSSSKSSKATLRKPQPTSSQQSTSWRKKLNAWKKSDRSCSITTKTCEDRSPFWGKA